MGEYQDQLVSIITPAYNAERFIASTVRSVQAQTYADWELLVADDCSADATVATLQAFAEQDPRVRVLVAESNGGPAAARNRAIEAARGRYVAFLDSDDQWLPEKLEAQITFMRETGSALTYTQYRRVSEDGETRGHVIDIPESLSYAQLLRNTAILTSTALVDRAMTGEFRMKRTYYDDYALWLELLGRGFVARGLPHDLTRYRVVGGSVSHKKGKSALMVWRTYREVERIGLLRSSWSFAGYAWNALQKYRSF